MLKYLKSFQDDSSSLTMSATASGRDWTKCFICQKKGGELKNPALSPALRGKPTQIEALYRATLSNLRTLRSLDELPSFVHVDELVNIDVFSESNIGGGGSACVELNTYSNECVQMMVTHGVLWHKSCKNAVDNQKVERAKRRCEDEPENTHDVASPVKARRKSHVAPSSDLCFFCEQTISCSKSSRRASTLGLDKNVREAAIATGDRKLLGKLSGGDMVARDAVYHLSCLNSLYHRARKVSVKTKSEDDDAPFQKEKAFEDLITYLEELKGSGKPIPMKHLITYYEQLLISRGCGRISIHSTRLRQEILKKMPKIKGVELSSGWHLIFDEDVVHMDASSDDIKLLSKAAALLRQDVLKKKQSMGASFTDVSEKDSVVEALIIFLEMLLDGNASNDSSSFSSNSKIVLSIAQIIMFNCVEKRTPSSKPRHPQMRETPLPLMLAMKIHLKTGQKTLIDTFAERGLCTSYARTRQISCDLANSAIKHWENKGVVVPLQAVEGAFTTCGIDNIDYNPSSTTASTALHGTGISVVQHHNNPLESSLQHCSLPVLDESVMGKRTVLPLPSFYSSMDDVILPSSEVLYIPSLPLSDQFFPNSRSLQEILQPGYAWLEHVERHMDLEISNEHNISWGAYHAAMADPPQFISKSYMLPLFTEKADSPITVNHCMKMIVSTTNHLNPGQTPVMVCDQPLFTIAKRLQWRHPNTDIGEAKFLVMIGAMHVEKMLWSVSGDWLDQSGWTSVITNSGVFSCGTAQSFMSVSHIMRTRYIHQVTVSALYILLKRAYNTCIASQGLENTVALEEWAQDVSSAHPQADFWLKALELDLLVLQVAHRCLSPVRPNKMLILK